MVTVLIPVRWDAQQSGNGPESFLLVSRAIFEAIEMLLHVAFGSNSSF